MMNTSRQKTVYLNYYALLREESGVFSEPYVTSALTVGELYQEIKNRYGFGVPDESLKVAINDAFSSWQEPLNTGDRVAFIPPVSGG